MIHLMIDPNSAAEFSCAKGRDDKHQMSELFSSAEIAARKPSMTYMPDGRKVINGHVESSLSPKRLWEDTLIRGRLVHQMSDANAPDHHCNDIKPKKAYSFETDTHDMLEIQSSDAKKVQPGKNLSKCCTDPDHTAKKTK